VFGFLARITFFEKHPQALSYANTVGGGVLLGVAFMHLIPEVIEGFADIEHDLDYPIGYVLILAGYLLILMLEKVIFHHSHDGGSHSHDQGHTKEKGYASYEKPEPANAYRRPVPSDKLLEEEYDEIDAETEKKNNIITPIALALALGIHSLFEGIVFGVQENPQLTLTMMIAISCHKPIEMLFMGIVMVKEFVSRRFFIFIISILAICTPLGTGIGRLVMSSQPPDVVVQTFSALAAGSFIYISTTEIISEEFQVSKSAKTRWFKFLCLLLGLGFIFIIRTWLDDGHTHEHDHDHDNDTDHFYR
jgi:zinc transporter 1/2/3